VPPLPLGTGMVSCVLVDPPFAGLGFVSEQFVFSFSLGAGTVSPGAGTVLPGAGTVLPGAGTVSPGAGTVLPGAGTVSPGAGTVSLGAGIGPLVAGMVVLLVLQKKRYTGIENMISRHLWVWFVEVMLEEVLLTAGLEEFCIVLLVQLVPLMVSLVDPSGAGTVLFEETVVVFTNVVFSEVVVFSEDVVVSLE